MLPMGAEALHPCVNWVNHSMSPNKRINSESYADRAVLALSSRLLSRAHWPVFFLKLTTLRVPIITSMHFMPVGVEYRVTALDLGFRRGRRSGSGRLAGWPCGYT